MAFELLIGEKKLPENSIVNERVAVRAVIYQNESVLMIRTNKGDYKLPGGGLNQGEDLETALIREVAEETGYVHVTVGKKLGEAVQQQIDSFDLEQFFRMKSVYFMCELQDMEQIDQKLDEYEAELGYSVEFVPLQKAFEVNQTLLNRTDRNDWVERETRVFEKLIRLQRKITSVYFVRHAQPCHEYEDRIRPLSKEGIEDSKKVVEILQEVDIDYVISSPYKRSMDTIAECAIEHGLIIHTDERFRERQAGENGNVNGMFQKRWDDFTFHEDGGESLQLVQRRNVEALMEVLNYHAGENIVIGTHGTALSTILNYYEGTYNCENFLRMIDFMPYIIRLDFKGRECIGKEELLIIEKEYSVK